MASGGIGGGKDAGRTEFCRKLTGGMVHKYRGRSNKPSGPPADLAGACSGEKFIESRAGEAYDPHAGGPNRRFRVYWRQAENPRRDIGSADDQLCGLDLTAFALEQQPEMESRDGLVFHDLEEVRGVSWALAAQRVLDGDAI